MSDGLTVDTREFERAIGNYARDLHKDLAYSAKRQMKNWAIKGVEVARRANESAIAALASRPIWGGVIAHIVNKAKGRVSSQTFRATQDDSRRILKNKRMREISRAIIAKRRGAVNFLKIFFVRMAGVFGGSKSVPHANNLGKSMFVTVVQPLQSNPSCSVTVRYDYKYRSGKVAVGAESILNQALRTAMQMTIEDMRTYVIGQLNKRAFEYGGVKS